MGRTTVPIVGNDAGPSKDMTMLSIVAMQTPQGPRYNICHGPNMGTMGTEN